MTREQHQIGSSLLSEIEQIERETARIKAKQLIDPEFRGYDQLLETSEKNLKAANQAFDQL